MVFVRSPYNYQRSSEECGIDCSVEPDMAQQQFKDECDINIIMKRFGKTGVLPAPAVMPQYGDYSQAVDYRSCMQAVRDAEEAFMELPADLRKKFNHDPQLFLEFCEDNSNYEEAQRMGLVPPPAPVVAPSEGVDEPPSKGAGPVST